jgi:hypothetical protein
MRMAWLAMTLCSLVAVLGALGVVSPDALLQIARRFETPGGLYAAAALRIVVGGVLVLAAGVSRAPRAIRLIGALIVVAGLVTPFLGLGRVHAILEWWAAVGPIVKRVWAGGALVFGCVMVYALAPGSRGAGPAER